MDAFEGNGARPRRTTPRMMCFTSASGCSLLSDAALAFSLAQSVLDFTEVDLRFALCGFAEGDDADFMFTLRMDY